VWHDSVLQSRQARSVLSSLDIVVFTRRVCNHAFYGSFCGINFSYLCCRFVHLLLTLVVQLCIMRDVERMTGPLRMAIIYLGSGMGGNLASAIFVPYRGEVHFYKQTLLLYWI
jgi:hypothetical protein